ncbi:MAG: RHS repeat-associated core domain-containing protein [Gemmatimonadetes bacterium]|nr:RHS repeat-associated core domain-containing protein [Gemmatimonadota bacterium]
MQLVPRRGGPAPGPRATPTVVDTLAAILDPINGTVRGLARFRTGAKVKEFAEAPWGDAVADTGIVVRYHFAGREYDGESGLYYMRARYYDPALGRWISEDPIGIAGGLNVYAYAGNDPVNLTDPSGLEPRCTDVHLEGYDENWTCRSEEDKEGTFSAPEQPYWNPLAPGTRHGVGVGAPLEVLRQRVGRTGCPAEPLAPTPLVVAVFNPVDTYEWFHSMRPVMHHLFRGEALSSERHFHGSYEATRQFGPFLAWQFGLLNELEGLVRHDLPNLGSRLTGKTAWAFSARDVFNNARGSLRPSQEGHAGRIVVSHHAHLRCHEETGG